MSDLIYLRGLRAETRIGCLAWERAIRQTVVLDLELEFDTRPAGTSDDLSHTLDYSAVAQCVVSVVEAAEFQLIEALAEHVAHTVLTEFPVSALSLDLGKPDAVPGARAIGLRIHRRRADYPS